MALIGQATLDCLIKETRIHILRRNDSVDELTVVDVTRSLVLEFSHYF